MALVDVKLFHSYISVLPCLCLRIAMTASVDTVLCFSGMALRLCDFRFGSVLWFLCIM